MAAARLPRFYPITPNPADQTEFLTRIEQVFDNGLPLLQLRAKTLQNKQLVSLARQVVAVADRYNSQIVINADPALVELSGAHGVHLDSRRLMQLKQRPLPPEYWVAASCHNAAELKQAQNIGVDFAVLAPVLATSSHPEATPLGWEKFAEICDNTALPIFALGGLTQADLPRAINCYAQGVAGIGTFFK
jgi:8-oxo-dGTP diphosphatase